MHRSVHTNHDLRARARREKQRSEKAGAGARAGRLRGPQWGKQAAGAGAAHPPAMQAMKATPSGTAQTPGESPEAPEGGGGPGYPGAGLSSGRVCGRGTIAESRRRRGRSGREPVTTRSVRATAAPSSWAEARRESFVISAR